MIETVFAELRNSGVVHTGAAFSQDWLGMEESYWRCLRAKRRPPSPKALATCAARLRKKAQLFGLSTLPEAKLMARRMDQLAEQCVEELLAVCEN